MKPMWMVSLLAAAALAAGQAPGPTPQPNLIAESKTPPAVTETAGDMPADSIAYADGKKAIHEGRWADAVKILEGVTARGGVRADSALYWKAYALNKMGQSAAAVQTCRTLQNDFAGSSWVEDCQALTIEIRAARGEAVQPKEEQSDELKLLALATLMQRDPARATEQIKEIVAGDTSEKLKEGAVFILGQQVPDQVYPQIVRISFLEGDARIARIAENEKSKNPTWEAAVMNLPLNEGDSIVTGKDGRVEIELEDASTVYLGENSVLNFTDLHTTGGVPHTELALVSGTLTLHLDSLMGGETFLLRTPTESLLSRYPEKVHLRVNSYLDGIAITSMGTGGLNVQGAGKQELTPGKTLFFSEGRRVTTIEQAGKSQDLAAFDTWVADRFAARSSANAELMKDTGLTRPIPGLADMKGKGHFFDCPPYGVCWEPDAPGANAMLTAPTPPPPAPKSSTRPAQVPPNMAASWFPCLSTWYPGMMVGQSLVPVGYANNQQAFYYGVDPYAWAVCHSGEWIPRNDGYAWVASGRRHHHCPVHWVRFGGKTGVVPIHPRDVKGQLPLNSRHGGFVPVKSRDGLHLTPIKLDPGRPVEVVKSVPRDFRNAPQPFLPRVNEPSMRGIALHDNPRAGLVSGKPVPINFTHQQGFVASHQIMQGGHPVTVMAPVGRAGGGGFSGGGSVHASGPGFGAVGTGVVHGGFTGGGSTGGSGHAGGGGMTGGGSVGGGGGGHVGGGGGGASVSSGAAPVVSTGGGATSATAPSSSPSPK